MKKAAKIFQLVREAVIVLIREPGRFLLRAQRKPPAPKMALLALLLSSPAAAQNLPFDTKDTATQETAEFLMQEITKGGLQNRNNKWKGTNEFEGNVTITGTLTISSGVTGSFVDVSSVNLTGRTEASANTCLTCVGGSTISVTGSAYRVCYQGNYGPDAGAGSGLAIMGFLVDGACPEGHTCNATLSSALLSTQHEWTTNGQGLNMSFCSPSIFSTSDERDFCLLACNNQAGGTLGRNSNAYFWVESIPR